MKGDGKISFWSLIVFFIYNDLSENVLNKTIICPRYYFNLFSVWENSARFRSLAYVVFDGEPAKILGGGNILIDRVNNNCTL